MISKKKWIVYDFEFDRLHNPDIMWVMCAEDNLGEKFELLGSDPDWVFKFEKLMAEYPLKVGHNVIDYDNHVATERFGVKPFKWEEVVDTLVLSRLVDYGARKIRHSLDAWGEEFGVKKVPVEIYDEPSLLPLYRERCRVDADINVRLWKKLLKYWESKKWALSIQAELTLAHILRESKSHGFKLDVSRAEEMRREMAEQLDDLWKDISSIPRPFAEGERKKVRRKRDGGLYSYDQLRIELDLAKLDKNTDELVYPPEEFNPNSHKQRIDVLNYYGWKPTEKSKGHARAGFNVDPGKRKEMEIYGWKVNETNLATLPADVPEGVKALAQHLTLKARHDDVVEWLGAVSSDGYVRGHINHIGAWTHRCAHSNPNTGNIYSPFHAPEDHVLSPVEQIKDEWDEDLRSLWIVEDDEVLMGVDAEGIQLRVLAEYMGDENYKNAVETGDKKKATDIHNVNLRALDLDHLVRDDAKTFIYAWILGSGLEKTASILKTTTAKVPKILEGFLNNLPGLKRVKEETIPEDFKTGFFRGFDGRFVRIPYERLTLAGYLQNGEKVIMTHWLINWYKEAKKQGIPFHLVNFVHDEFQIAVKPEYVTQLSTIMENALHYAVNEVLGLWVQHAMEVKVGKNWAESH